LQCSCEEGESKRRNAIEDELNHEWDPNLCSVGMVGNRKEERIEAGRETDFIGSIVITTTITQQMQ
jgi:flagellar biosynthesis regulator FlaF